MCHLRRKQEKPPVVNCKGLGSTWKKGNKGYKSNETHWELHLHIYQVLCNPFKKAIMTEEELEKFFLFSCFIWFRDEIGNIKNCGKIKQLSMEAVSESLTKSLMNMHKSVLNTKRLWTKTKTDCSKKDYCFVFIKSWKMGCYTVTNLFLFLPLYCFSSYAFILWLSAILEQGIAPANCLVLHFKIFHPQAQIMGSSEVDRGS